jgi:hypothetical protein
MGLDWEKHFRLSSFLLISLSNHLSSAGLNRSSGGFIPLATRSSLKRRYLVSTLIPPLDPPPPPLDPCHCSAKTTKPPYSSLSILVVVLVHLIVRSETALVA